MPVVVIAPDKFKGSLAAPEVAAALAGGILAERPDVTIRCVAVADGGDGTVAAAVAAGWTSAPVQVPDAVGRIHDTCYARQGRTAIVGVAETVGLELLGSDRDPLHANTFGLGKAILSALQAGTTEIIVGLGGSASTDGGSGMLRALGARVLDADGEPVPLGGAGLLVARRLDLAAVTELIAGVDFTIAGDVDNPLLGSGGAATVFGPQKGASSADVEVLEQGLAQWADLMSVATGRDVHEKAGAGAAGGTGLALLAALRASQRSGFDVVWELCGGNAALADADLVITGEGSLDTQTLRGKAPLRVAQLGYPRPVVAVVGHSLLSQSQWAAAGFTRCYALTDLARPQQSIAEAAALLHQVGGQIAREMLD